MSEVHRHRCAWPGADPLYIAYHDEEWGVPERRSEALFAKLCLDGFQAGLSWITILRKRDAFNAAFYGFDPARVAAFDEGDVDRLLQNPGIVRSKAKILGVIGNARAYLSVQDQGVDFAAWIWSHVDNSVVQASWAADEGAPTQSPQSVALSLALRRRGFSFCGPVIVYAFMQACGLVNDHAPDCFRCAELGGRNIR